MGRWSAFALIGILGATGAAWAEGTPSALVEQLRDPDHEVSAVACEALRKLGAEAVPALVKGLRPAGTRQRLLILQALAGIGPAASEAVPAVADCIVPGWDSDAGAPPYPGYTASYRLPPLPWDQAAATLALPALGPRGRNVLFRLPAYCPSEVEARALLSALAECGKDAVPSILTLLEPGTARLWSLSPQTAMRALEAIGPDAAAELRRRPMWQDWSPCEDAWAALSAGPTLGATDLPALLDSVPSEGTQTWHESPWSLARRSWTENAIVELARQAVHHPNPRARSLASGVLAGLPSVPSEALPYLRQALEDRDADVRRQAALAIGRVRRAPDEAVRILRDFVRAWPCDRHAADWARPGDRVGADWARPGDREAAAWALRALGVAEGRALLLNERCAPLPAAAWPRVPGEWTEGIVPVTLSGAVPGIESLIAEFDRELEGVVPVLVAWCRGDDADLVRTATTALAQVREPRDLVFPAVLAGLEAVDGGGSHTRRLWPVSRALSEMGPEVIPYALERLGVVRRDGGYMLLEVLESFGRVPADCVPSLSALVSDPECMVRGNLLGLLVRSAEPAALRAMVQAYLAEDSMVQPLGQALWQLPDHGAELLVPWLESPDDGLRLRACRAASVVQYKAAPAIVQAVRGLALEDPVEEIRTIATWAVWYHEGR